MIRNAPAAASPSAAPSQAKAGGSGPAARSVCRRPTFLPPLTGGVSQRLVELAPTRGLRSRRLYKQWSDGPSDNERRLYGALMPEVTFLRKRGFGVHCEGDLFRVGNRLLDAEGLLSIAARERRLIQK